MAHEILVVVDVQNDFVTGSLGSKYAQVAKDNIIDLLKSNKFDLLVSRYDTNIFAKPNKCYVEFLNSIISFIANIIFNLFDQFC